MESTLTAEDYKEFVTEELRSEAFDRFANVCSSGSLIHIQHMIEALKSKDMYYPEEYIGTILYSVATSGNEKCIDFILTQIGRLGLNDPYDMNIIVHGLVCGGHQDLLKKYMPNAKPTKSVWNFWFLGAAAGGNQQLIDMCLKNGANDFGEALSVVEDKPHAEITTKYLISRRDAIYGDLIRRLGL